jgi:hypothetical protein
MMPLLVRTVQNPLKVVENKFRLLYDSKCWLLYRYDIKVLSHCAVLLLHEVFAPAYISSNKGIAI